MYDNLVTIIKASWADSQTLTTLRPRQNGRQFPDDIFKCIFLNENAWIHIKNSLKFVPKSLINKIPALVQMMAWRRLGDKPSSEPMMVILLTHICVTRPQWVIWKLQWLLVLTISFSEKEGLEYTYIWLNQCFMHFLSLFHTIPIVHLPKH